MHFFPIFNKTPLKFPISWVWVMFTKHWEKTLLIQISLQSLHSKLSATTLFNILNSLRKTDKMKLKIDFTVIHNVQIFDSEI